MSAALHNALPGVQIDVEEAPDLSLPVGQSARARLAVGRQKAIRVQAARA